jgi:hypothetical protein
VKSGVGKVLVGEEPPDQRSERRSESGVGADGWASGTGGARGVAWDFVTDPADFAEEGRSAVAVAA